MEIRDFSRSQLLAMSWWCPDSSYRDLDGVICDGAVRSGKTLCMGLGFFFWATFRFRGQAFGLCGKTVGGLRRNLLSVVLPVLRELGFDCREQVSKNCLTLSYGGNENRFYLFGGKDEASAALIQGVTFAGVLLDEVALMPQSFVEQACARCSVKGSKIWFNCNPEGPGHWFYREWIEKAGERKMLYIPFRMEDNPGLDEKTLERYRRMFSGVFYRRFVRGEWVAAQGLVYDFFDGSFVKPAPEGPFDKWVISCDYGTVNPTSMGLWGRQNGVWYRVKEFYHDSRKAGRQKTDGEYARDLAALAGGRRLSAVVVDPSAASFMELLRREGYTVLPAKNQVLSGIRLTAEKLKSGEMVICEGCGDAIREFGLYVWQEGAEAPKKEHDHAMDDIRYFAATVLGESAGGWPAALAVERQASGA